jgi:Glu-tRNA(Gln) amidotransferase subunit E-like FAD-binding protein
MKGSDLRKLTKEYRKRAAEKANPHWILSRRLDRALDDVFRNPHKLEIEAQKGHSQYSLLRLDQVQHETHLNHLSMDEIHEIIKKLIQEKRQDLRRQGFALVLNPWWFKNEVSLAWG